MALRVGPRRILLALPRLAAAVMLFLALGKHSYGYYQLLRIVVTVAAAHGAYLGFRGSGSPWAWFFIGCVLLFNPVAPVHLTRQTWAFIDVAAAFAFLISLYYVPARGTG